MHIVTLLILAKIAFILLCAMFGAMFVVEFFPAWAAKAQAATAGTHFDFAGLWLAQGLQFCIEIAQKVLLVANHLLHKIGIDVEYFQNLAKEAGKAADGVPMQMPDSDSLEKKVNMPNVRPVHMPDVKNLIRK